jgi:hypothetical protein
LISGAGRARACTRTTATRTTGTATGIDLRLHRQQAFALQLLARELTGATNGFSLLAGLLLRRLFVMSAEFHLAENTLALHLLLERLEGLVNIVVANENLHAASFALAERVIGLKTGDDRRQKGGTLSSGGRMYQIESELSTGREGPEDRLKGF